MAIDKWDHHGEDDLPHPQSFGSYCITELLSFLKSFTNLDLDLCGFTLQSVYNTRIILTFPAAKFLTSSTLLHTFTLSKFSDTNIRV